MSIFLSRISIELKAVSVIAVSLVRDPKTLAQYGGAADDAQGSHHASQVGMPRPVELLRNTMRETLRVNSPVVRAVVNLQQALNRKFLACTICMPVSPLLCTS